jgi:hypothetical protein
MSRDELHIRQYKCPVCVGGLIVTTVTGDVDKCLHCGGTGLTDDPLSGSELAPRPPGVMRAACADCAFRRGSPELDNAGVTLPADEPFFCHQGVPISAAGSYESVATFRGLPLGLLVCAGWWAMKTGEALPATPYREVPVTEAEVTKRWGPRP